LTRQHFYHVGANEANRNPMLEAIVLNYNPLVPVAIELEKQLALFEKPTEQYVVFSSPATPG
jgi:DNA adenine methylase